MENPEIGMDFKGGYCGRKIRGGRNVWAVKDQEQQEALDFILALFVLIASFSVRGSQLAMRLGPENELWVLMGISIALKGRLNAWSV